MEAFSLKDFSFLHSPTSFDVIRFFSEIDCKIYLISKLAHSVDVAESTVCKQVQCGQQLKITDIVLEFSGYSPKFIPSSNQFCEMLRRVENNIISIAAKRSTEIRISLGTGALINSNATSDSHKSNTQI